MSLELNGLGTDPGVVVKTWDGKTVDFGGHDISIRDFLYATYYVLTNTDLEPDDPRLQFVKCLQSMTVIDGYNPGQKRLISLEEPPVPTS